ncbi:MAG: class I SAM-dependent methyltransferase [Acidimicrobiia bacterium]
MAAPRDLDMHRMQAFGAQLAGYMNGASVALMMSVGHRTGLFDAMAALAPSTSHEIAEAAGLNERYVREWLGSVASAGIVEYDAVRDAFSLPREHAALLTRTSPRNTAATAQLVSVFGSVEDQIVERFREGGGLTYDHYGRFSAVMAELSRAMYDHALVDSILPLVPGLVEALHRGIDVADIATGSGHAINVMARAFPNSRFTGYDISVEGIERGRAEATGWGLTNAFFEVVDVATLDAPGRFDFLTTFDAVHDQAQPHVVVQRIHDALKPGAYWLCVDIGASSNVGENLSNPMAPMLYATSCMHCMSVSLAHGGPGLGAMWGVQTARAMFADAGFVEVKTHRLPSDPVNNYYVCRRG